MSASSAPSLVAAEHPRSEIDPRVVASRSSETVAPSASSSVDSDLVELRSSLAGPVLSPSDPGYDAARICFNALVDRRPAVIAKCTGAGDVSTAFDFARVQNLEVAVRGGGHNPAGHCVLDGGLVIDLSLLRDVEVDSNARTARSEGGSTWADFDSATQVDGLVTPGGVVGSTGVCGLALSGGYANYMQADEPTERVRSAFGSDAYERL
jgi:hypothetical protein